VIFHDNSTAGSANLVGSEEGFITFLDHSTAGNATIFGGNPLGEVDFFDSSTAGSATIQGLGSHIFFAGSSKGGTSAISLFLGGLDDTPSILDISYHNAPGATIGSLEGDVTTIVFLGANNLTIGSNNLSTTFAGVIQDGGYNGNGGTGGSLTKIGSGRLTLSGANTYTASPDQFSVLNVLGSADLNGFLDPVLLNGFVPTLGQTFTFLDYASLTGEFARIKHRVFDNGMLQWSVIYEGNQAILIVEQHVPDQGSTFLLLTLGLLGIVTYHRQLARKQFLSRERVLFLTSLHARARGATGTLS
jgi:VPDSG-CTERM motif